MDTISITTAIASWVQIRAKALRMDYPEGAAAEAIDKAVSMAVRADSPEQAIDLLAGIAQDWCALEGRKAPAIIKDLQRASRSGKRSAT